MTTKKTESIDKAVQRELDKNDGLTVKAAKAAKKTLKKTEKPSTSTSTIIYAERPKVRRTLNILNPKDMLELTGGRASTIGPPSTKAVAKALDPPVEAVKPGLVIRCAYVMPGGLQCTRSEHSGTDHRFAAGEPQSEVIEPEQLKQKSPGHPVPKAMLRAGFKYAKSVRIDEKNVAHGYTHPDGSAAVFFHDATNTEIGFKWTLKTKTGKGAEGKTAPEFAAVRYDQVNVALPAVTTLAALRVLGKETSGTYDITSLAGDDDANYGARLRVLKALRGNPKVVVKDARVVSLRKELHGILKAKSAGDFTLKAAAVLKDTERRVKTIKAAEADVDAARLAAANVKPRVEVFRKPSKADRTKETAQLVTELRAKAAEGEPEIAEPDPLRFILHNPKAVRALEFRNGAVCLQLEAATSQGAIVVCDNGTRVSASVMTKKILHTAKAMEDQDCVALAHRLLEPLNKKVQVRPSAVAHLRAFLAAVDLQVLREEDGPCEPAIREPAAFTMEPVVNAKTAILLEDLRSKTALLQIEAANSQGAVVVYNNGRHVTLGIAPPEILQTLRPSLNPEDVNQLLSPDNGAQVTSMAYSHLTAMQERCKELIEMAAKKAAKKFEAPAGVAKKAVAKKTAAKTEPTERKSSLFRLVLATKATWAAFTGQKAEIITAFTKLGAAGKTAKGVTRAALIEALPDVGPKNISFYLSKWQAPGLIEKLPAAE